MPTIIRCTNGPIEEWLNEPQNVNDMRQQVTKFLDDYRNNKPDRTVSMPAIRKNGFNRVALSPQSIQKLIIEEYVEEHPDAFDTIQLADPNNGFKNVIIHIRQKNQNNFPQPIDINDFGIGFIDINSETIKAETIQNCLTALGLNNFVKIGHKNCYQKIQIIIEEGITEIESKAFAVTDTFKACKGLISVTIPDSVTRIGEGAFNGCTGLISVHVGNNVTEIGEGAFSGCEKLTSLGQNLEEDNPRIEIPRKVRVISANLFKDCRSLTMVKFYCNVRKIGRGAFWGCTALVRLGQNVEQLNKGNISIPQSVTEIGSRAFEGCTRIQKVNIIGNVTEIRRMTFSQEERQINPGDEMHLEVVRFPNTVRAIWNGAFDGCTALTRPQNITDDMEIAHDAFVEGLGIVPQNRPNIINHYDIQHEEELSITKIFGIAFNRKDEVVQFFVDWMGTPYSWPDDRRAKNEKDTTLEFYGYSRWLNYSLINNDKSSIDDCIANILEWGGVGQHLENVPQFRKALQKINNDLSVDKIMRLDRDGRSASAAAKATSKTKQKTSDRDRISTWSKVLAAYMPGRLFIYDSRVALALSYISLKLNAPCFWQIPQDQNDKIKNRHFIDESFNGQTVKKATKDNRGDNIVCISDRKVKQWKEDGLDIPTCYSRYLLLLNALAHEQRIMESYDNIVAMDKSIGDAYEKAFAFIQDAKQRKDKAIMAHLEKVLFMKKDDLLAP